MKYTLIYSLILTTISFYSCSDKDTFENTEETTLNGEIEFNNFVADSSTALNIDFRLPKNMSESTELIPDSPFQYVDTVKNYCLVGYVETVSSAKSGLENLNYYDGSIPFPSAYNAYMFDMMSKNTFEHGVAYNERETNLNGFGGKLAQVDIKVDAQSETLVYWVASFECKSNFYRFIGWTEKNNQADFDKIFVDFLASVRIK